MRVFHTDYSHYENFIPLHSILYSSPHSIPLIRDTPVCSTNLVKHMFVYDVCTFCRVIQISVTRKHNNTVVGHTGVWKLLYGDFSSTKEDIVKRMSKEEWIMQPETENFMLIELTIG